MNQGQDTTPIARHEDWLLLQLYCLYRLLLCIAFLLLVHQNLINPFYGDSNPQFFQRTSLFYALFSSVCLLLCNLKRPHYLIQTNLFILIDLFFLFCLYHASGGILSGMGLLFIIVIAAHSILSPGKHTFLMAAITTLGLLIEHYYQITHHTSTLYLYNQVGLLGLIIFIMTVFCYFLSIKIRQNQNIIQIQAQQLSASIQLNSYIIDTMHQGIIAIDNNNQIRLMNHAAKKLLHLPEEKSIPHLKDLPPLFQNSVSTYRSLGKNISPIIPGHQLPEIRLDFQRFGKPPHLGTLIFIYDTEADLHQAQELKLASLGHLTANIAHELRNPLGAVSHATQLLNESENLQSEQHQLLDLVLQNCNRMNQVIKNVLSISSRKSNAHSFLINGWLKDMVPSLNFPLYPKAKIHLDLCENDLNVHIDPSQFLQVLVNLCENGLRYSQKKSGTPSVTIKTSYQEHTQNIFVDIIDQGTGVPEQIKDFIFEPFYTTESNGTGLGLYLARQLCHQNGTSLEYAQHPSGSQFRITFSAGGQS